MAWYLVDTECAGIHSNVIVKADSPEQAEKDVSVIEFFKDELSYDQKKKFEKLSYKKQMNIIKQYLRYSDV
ncbi:hypothetical protein B5E73_04375 [Ligilactobacillus salivarius]|uniref:hypothetical protein n=1 Tax=Ligilactobacillus salivarius TaxID=1624 RepID=UPI000B37AF9C|nr:hypothetical protein [Ligilactobacillus salivarius]OUQ31986.1 hypothetical protein B5E73_04375 [Ligilactobacillus salivarius]